MKTPTAPRIAVVGAGFSGVLLARALGECAEVTVFEKSRGVGGRMATRRAATFQFDHGLPFFTARSRAFQRFLAPWQAQGVVQEWQGKVISALANGRVAKRLWFEPHWVACPGMNALVKALAGGVQVELGCEVAPLTGEGPPWQLTDINGKALGEFDWVICTAPAPQTARLLAGKGVNACPLMTAPMQAAHAVLLGVEQRWPHAWIASKLHESPLAWLWVDSSKPGRDASRTALVAHTTADWTANHLDTDTASLAPALLAEIARVTGLDTNQAAHVAVHRWRYATAIPEEEPEYWLDPLRGLVACGDWSCAPRVEALWHQANDVAEAIRALLP